LLYQLAASVFQPFIGYYFDRKPAAWSLPAGMTFTLTGIISLAFASDIYFVYLSVLLIGTGSSVLHPEAAKITSFASGGRRGLAQSFFQVGGNLGSSLGPLLIAIFVSPYGRQYIAGFSLLAVLAIIIMIPVCRWYIRTLRTFFEKKLAGTINKQTPFPFKITVLSIGILLVLIFSKYIYVSSLVSYYTFYLIEKFDVSIQTSQLFLFVFSIATAAGTLIGGTLSDRIGRKYVIWFSILGASPFALLMPHADLFWTVILSFCVGLILSSAFPAILVYAQELLPGRVGLMSGLFYGFAFGVAGMASAVLGRLADIYGLDAIYHICAFMPLMGLVAWFLPDLRKKR
jgi:FSR family fosmidomycin resistance protein-like MFS transporter